MTTINKGIVVLALIVTLSACDSSAQKPTNVFQQTATNLPDVNFTKAPTTTYTPTQEITKTPRPTRTPETVIVNAYDFMNPILESISNRPPDYQDDFSNPNSGWPSGRQPPNGHEEGILGYENGEYFIMADAAKFPFEMNPDKKITCLSAFHNPQINVLDFVMEVDARFVTHSGNGDWQIKFWEESDYYYGVRMDNSGWVGFHTSAPLSKYLGDNDLRETGTPRSFRRTELNHVVIVARDSKIAITLNDQIVVFMDEVSTHKRGPISFVVCNFGTSPYRSEWDNLKIWDLSK